MRRVVGMSNRRFIRTRRRLAQVPCAVAVVIAVALAPATALGAFPGANGRIAYSLNTGGPGEPTRIHTVLPSGHGDETLAVGMQPSWSANGRRIVFTRYGSSEPNPDVFT